MSLIVHGASLLFCGLWAGLLVYMWRSALAMPQLDDEMRSLDCAALEWPLLSVIIPACNEADHIEAALTSLLAQDYPRLEVVVVDDRSSDATDKIIDRLAAGDARVRYVRIESLPPGWLGKVHALHTGVRQARGEWYLFTDADVRFEPGVLRHAICYAARRRIEHLTCLPEIVYSGFWLEVAIRSFFLLFCPSARLAAVNRESGRVPIGIGAFNLVEASALEHTPGFEWLRMEPADDLGLGLMLFQSGARTHLLNAQGQISVPWYDSVGAMIRGLEKNSFGPGARYRYWRQLVIVSILWLVALVPAASVAMGLWAGDPTLLAAGTAAYLVNCVIAFAMPRDSIRDVCATLCLPIGVMLISVILLRSAYLCRRNGGIDWRGTHYRLAELRRGQRVKF